MMIRIRLLSPHASLQRATRTNIPPAALRFIARRRISVGESFQRLVDTSTDRKSIWVIPPGSHASNSRAAHVGAYTVVFAALSCFSVALGYDEAEPANCSAINAAHKSKELARIATPIEDITKMYTNFEIIGEGGFGKVYRATQRSNGREVALKRIPKEWTENDEFQREVNVLCRLNDGGGHPNICKLYDVFENDDEYWLSMELIEGGEVFEHLIERGAYSEAMAATFLRQFAEALAYMHSAGVVQ